MRYINARHLLTYLQNALSLIESSKQRHVIVLSLVRLTIFSVFLVNNIVV